MLKPKKIKQKELTLDLPKKISKYVTSKELVKSTTAIRHGIDNTPTWEHYENAKRIATKIFDVVRENFAVPLYISSFYRSNALNEKIGGSKTSQHSKGEAMDIDADVYGGVSNADVFNYIKDNLEFDQLIWEFGDSANPDWVHVSLKKENNRKEILVAYKDHNNKTKYRHYD